MKIKWREQWRALVLAVDRMWGGRSERRGWAYGPPREEEDSVVDGLPMDHLSRSALNGFSTCLLDRACTSRRDSRWLEEQLLSDSARLIPLWDSKNLFNGEDTLQPVFFLPSEIEDMLHEVTLTAFLGVDGDVSYVAFEVPSREYAETLAEYGSFRDLKSVGALLDERESNLLAYARGIIHWHRRNRFCGDCGSETMIMDGGHMRVCTNSKCGMQHFPRTDPAVIVLVNRGEECLLGRQPSWPKGMYSTIAGFVEPGETLEGAVVREVWEETGVEVESVHYHSSQPWPFPGSIMLGFHAHASSGEIRLGEDELEDARWFSREDIRRGVAEGAVRLPSHITIAYRLIEDWFDSDGRSELRKVVERG
ncbi:MAG: NAD(+) diphosphatase [Syntrophobacteraceae bacterium]